MPVLVTMDLLDSLRRRAAELGANGIIIHSMRNRGEVGGGDDGFGTGGSSRDGVYQVQATAIRYID